MKNSQTSTPSDFIRTIINKDLASGRHKKIIVRFPPEPNGFLHIGHAKSSTLNFGLASEYGGRCHLRFDDTNPETEDQSYVDAIKNDLRWLGFDWGEHEYYASDYFETLYEWACILINKGLAYVDDSHENVIRLTRGTVTTPGVHSRFRDRSPEENFELFQAMREGEFADGACVLRAKIDMAHPNMKMRDPLMYRIRHTTHYRHGDQWCIYPFYDWAHGQSDAIESVTHSICTLEFSTNRILYDWYLDALDINPRPRQYEFARLNLDYNITSKRQLIALVQEHVVDGWSDPRMPTLAGLRRRGIRSKAIRSFCQSVGTTRVDSRHDPVLLDHFIREDLNHLAPRIHCVQDPLPVTLTNWPENHVEKLTASYWPHEIPKEGTRELPISRELLIERKDFSETPSKGFRRLTPNGIVRLRQGYIIRCTSVEKDGQGHIIRLLCEYIDGTLSGENTSSLKPQGTIHWVDAIHSLPVIVRVYDRLLSDTSIDEDLWTSLNPISLVEHRHARIEPSVADDLSDQRYQFVRLGYYWRDPESMDQSSTPIFNCIVPLRDSSHKSTSDHSKEIKQTPKKIESSTPQRTLTTLEKQWLQRSGLPRSTGLAIYAVDGAIEFFQAAASSAPRVSVSNWMANHLLPALNERKLSDLPFGPYQFAELIQLADNEVGTAHEIRMVLKLMFDSNVPPAQLLSDLQDSMIDDPEIIKPLISDVLNEFSDRVTAYANGKVGLIGFFVGQVIKRVDGNVNPKQIQELVSEELARITS
ncbi:MAG: glutamine--tRNA ligase/YqeY domain fusion protein [Bacteroidetes bacterium]|nr:glutamine--tRNA ligase/YqeY domain fusion protein [Bacteroidota bacterium]